MYHSGVQALYLVEHNLSDLIKWQRLDPLAQFWKII